jgi:uncharacterized cofD-like protein
MSNGNKKLNVVVIGGGTGTYTVLSGLKKYDDLKLKVIVNVTDSGGSTGKLRDQFGILPVGDFRQALVALAEEGNGNNLLRELFLYRFEKGEGLKGHNFGNLLLTALTDILGSEQRAIRAASKILRIKGEVIMVAQDDVDLVAEYEDGSVLVGEAAIDEPNEKHNSEVKIKKLRIQPLTEMSEKATEALNDAEYIVIGPGDLYTSLLSNIVVPGVSEVIKKSKAKIIYIPNLMTKYGQTHGFKGSDFVEEMKKYIGKYPEIVLTNNAPLPKEAIQRYKESHEFPVVDDLDGKKYEVVRKDLLNNEIIERKEEDVDIVKRSLIRHDSHKLADELYNIITSEK